MNNYNIDEKSYRKIRRLDARLRSKKYHWFYEYLYKILSKSDYFWILNLTEKNPNLYLLADNNTKYSYEEIQIEANIRKLNNSTEDSLFPAVNACVKYLNANVKLDKYVGLCHGVRNGVEVKLFNNLLNGDDPAYKIIGTDISPTATNFDNVFQMDFHEEKEEFVGKFDFIYSNSLDQSNNPQRALHTWVDSLKPDGMLFVDLGKGGKSHWALLDPFCCEPEFFPLVALKFLKQKACVVDTIQKFEDDARNLIFVIKKL